jgi:hypothetical protein
MFLLNNKPLSPDTAFTHEGIQYPANWLRLATLEEKQAIGITEVPDPVRADDRFYWDGDINNPKALEDREEVDEDGNPLFVKVLGEIDGEPAMVDSTERLVTKGLKSQYIAQVKTTAGSLLATTDWMVIRKAERDVAIPPKVAQQRKHIVGESDRMEKAIAAVTSVEQLIEVLGTQQWGE